LGYKAHNESCQHTVNSRYNGHSGNRNAFRVDCNNGSPHAIAGCDNILILGC
jgi:hypothetical protein